MNNLLIFSTLFGTVFGSLITLTVQNILNNVNKKHDREYEMKQEIYIEISSVLQAWWLNSNDDELASKMNAILAKAYITAPDHVILGIKKIFNKNIENGVINIKGLETADLILKFRKDLMKNTKLKANDHIFLQLID